jgi:hypothetical protein
MRRWRVSNGINTIHLMAGATHLAPTDHGIYSTQRPAPYPTPSRGDAPAGRLYGAVLRQTFYGTIPAMPLHHPDPAAIRCVIFDFGGTLSSDFYFNVNPPNRPDWFSTIQQRLFADQPLVERWMRQELALEDIAAVLAPELAMPVAEVLHWAVLGCQQVKWWGAITKEQTDE